MYKLSEDRFNISKQQDFYLQMSNRCRDPFHNSERYDSSDD